MALNRENEKLVNTVYAGLFAALTALLTAVLHIPVGNGYVHCGDAVIYLAAAMLPLPYAAGAAAVGGALADVLSGYAVYALPTFIIKAMLAAVFSAVGGTQMLEKRRILAMILCGLVSVTGYWLTAVILYGGWAAQFVETVPGNCMQAIASGIVYAVIAAAMARNPRGKMKG
ncbi:MAG: TIGR04002 family protein [Oscillospiraceae bacterium]|nr:TIGR04002 family protein [Oscillospiraceae bacterium]